MVSRKQPKMTREEELPVGQENIALLRYPKPDYPKAMKERDQTSPVRKNDSSHPGDK